MNAKDHPNSSKPRNKIYYAFGEVVPQEFINQLLADGVVEEEITTEYLETLLEYERRDCE